MPGLAASGPTEPAPTTFLPFVADTPGEAPLSVTPRLSITVGDPETGASRVLTVSVDTGSTGVVVSAADLPGYSPGTAPPSFEFLSSSRRLWVGHRVYREIVFLAADGHRVAVARVPVLAVETEYLCPGWSEKANRPDCPHPGRTTMMPKGIAYMGVGFGREGDGQRQGTPDGNPFLNIAEIDGRTLASGAYRPGYAIGQDGVQLGVAKTDGDGFAWVKLARRGTESDDASARGGGGAGDDGEPADPRDWDQAPMAVSVNGGTAVAGDLLVDTGIAQMYLSLPDASAIPTENVANPSRPGVEVPAVADGTVIDLSLPDALHPTVRQRFTTGSRDAPEEPAGVLLSHGHAAAFLNTGRNFLKTHDIAFDAAGGWFGVRPSRR